MHPHLYRGHTHPGQMLKAKNGLTLLINEQSSKRVLKHADRIYVLRSGEVKLEDHACRKQVICPD